MVLIKPLNIHAAEISSYPGQALGFMFSPKGKASQAKLFVFKRRKKVGIHMLFVFFPLIVAWLDDEKRISHVSVMKPFVSFEAHDAKYVLEVPYNSGVLKKIKLNAALYW